MKAMRGFLLISLFVAQTSALFAQWGPSPYPPIPESSNINYRALNSELMSMDSVVEQLAQAVRPTHIGGGAVINYGFINQEIRRAKEEINRFRRLVATQPRANDLARAYVSLDRSIISLTAKIDSLSHNRPDLRRYSRRLTQHNHNINAIIQRAQRPGGGWHNTVWNCSARDMNDRYSNALYYGRHQNRESAARIAVDNCMRSSYSWHARCEVVRCVQER